ncbi:MAG: PorP/SprF family type IX secretion system membrane protein [Bacteroidota bacterium]
MKKIIVISVIIFNLCNQCYSQDIHFSQYNESPMTLNPALTGGFNGQIRAGLYYRDQWRSVTTPFRTIACAADVSNITNNWKSGYLAPGIVFYSDKAGDGKMGITQVNLSIASGILVNGNNTVAAGLQGGFTQHSVNFNDLEWGNQYTNGAYNASQPTGETPDGENFSFADFSSGIMWNYKIGETNISSNNAFAVKLGVSVFHINQPLLSYYNGTNEGSKLYRKYTIHGSVEKGLKSTNITLIPGFAYYNQGAAREVIAGCKVRYIMKKGSQYTGYKKGSAFNFGGYYRFKDAFVALVQIEFANYAVSFSYDINASGLTAVSSSRGGFEITLHFINPNPFQYKRYIHTPMM